MEVPGGEGVLDFRDLCFQRGFGLFGGPGLFHRGSGLFHQCGDGLVLDLGITGQIQDFLIILRVEREMDLCVVQQPHGLGLGILHPFQQIDDGLIISVRVGGLRLGDRLRGAAGQQKQGKHQAEQNSQPSFHVLFSFQYRVSCRADHPERRAARGNKIKIL